MSERVTSLSQALDDDRGDRAVTGDSGTDHVIQEPITDDIVTRLRQQAGWGEIDDTWVLLRDAADEITRLRHAGNNLWATLEAVRQGRPISNDEMLAAVRRWEAERG